MQGVHQKSFDTFREISIRIQLSYSRYNRQTIGSGNCLVNFYSILILPLSICDVCPYDAPWSGVRSKNNKTNTAIYISCGTWRPAFEWCMPDPSKSVLYHMTEVSSWSITSDKTSFGTCFTFRNIKNCWDRNVENCTGWCSKSRENLYLPRWIRDVYD